jgi:hypothetical protein
VLSEVRILSRWNERTMILLYPRSNISTSSLFRSMIFCTVTHCSVIGYQPEDLDLNLHRRESLKSHSFPAFPVS